MYHLDYDVYGYTMMGKN